MRTATVNLPIAAPSDGGAAPVDKPDALQPGSRLGAYELLTPLASGGMGHVWSAVRLGDFGFRRTAAIKVMREELAVDPGFRRMFLDEARLASRISHTNVVEVLDLGEGEGGVLFQAMALVDGDSLTRLEQRSQERGQQPSAAVAARITSDVLHGLHAAHELRADDGRLLEFVHRDVSPHNILVGLDGVAKITDFGVAKAAGATAKASRTGPQGKLAYMAPEQARGEEVDRRADIYAVGVVLWELLTGARLLREATGAAADRQVFHPCDVRPDAHPGLADVALRALGTRRDERFATAEEMADAVERAAYESGIVLSQRAVAAWVSELAGDHIKKKRLDTEAQLARTHAGTAWTKGDATESTMLEPAAPRSQRRLHVLIGCCVLLIVGASAIVVRKAYHTVPPSSAAPAQESAGFLASAPSAEPSVVRDEPALGTDAGAGMTTPSTASASSMSARPRPHAGARPPKPGPMPKPKYANPYEGTSP